MGSSEDGTTAAKPRDAARKDRLIQTRVPRELEATLKEEARKRRLSLSHLIRNALEDTFQLMDGVVADVDQIVSDSVHLAKNVQRNALRLASPSREPAPEPAPGSATGAASEPATGPDTHDTAPDEALDHVYAWNQVVLHRAAACSKCGAAIARGEPGFAGMSDEAGAPRAWLCVRCIEILGTDPAGSR